MNRDNVIFIDNVEYRIIKGFPEYAIGFNGQVYSFKSARFLKLYKITKGYIGCKLYNNKQKKSQKVHRLVATAFIPNIENKKQVNHIDQDKSNNSVSNLEWVTNKENARHTLKKLTIHDVDKIRVMLKKGISIYKIGKEFNIKACTVSAINHGRIWSE